MRLIDPVPAPSAEPIDQTRRLLSAVLALARLPLRNRRRCTAHHGERGFGLDRGVFVGYIDDVRHAPPP